MTDSIESLLKEAVKRAVADALAEGLQAAAPSAPATTAATVAKKAVGKTARKPVELPAAAVQKWKWVTGGVKTTALGAAAVAGVCYMLFMPEFAGAAPAFGKKSPVLSPAPVVSLDPDKWYEDLADLDKVYEMVKRGSILHARPDNLAAIVIFHHLYKMSQGKPIDINNLDQEFEDSLPDKWLPIYLTLKEKYPKRQIFIAGDDFYRKLHRPD